MTQKNKNLQLQELLLTALFAAIIFTGTFFFKIPVPPAMVHIGNALVVIAFFALGTRHAMIAATVGFGIFDLVTGYAASVVFTIMESLIVLSVLHIAFKFFQEKATLVSVSTLGVLAGIVKIIVIFIRKYINNLALVSGQTATIDTAFVTTLSSMVNTFITAAVTALLVPILYFLIKQYLPVLFKKPVA